MGRRRKAKYQIGDTIVITIYGTVGKITNVQWLDGTYVYEVNKSEELYKETCLKLLSEYEGDIIEKEHIDIEYKFLIGDIVQVTGHEGQLFKIVGFRTEIWRYKEHSWEDVIYELSRIGDGEWLEVNETDMVLMAGVEDAEAFMQKLGLLTLLNKQKDHQQKKELPMPLENKVVKYSELSKNEQINHLLDMYNDYRYLYEWFKDEEYAIVMKAVIRELKKISGNNNLK